MTTNNTTKRRTPAKPRATVTEPPTVDAPPPLPPPVASAVLDEDVAAAIRASREATGMDEVYAEIENRVTLGGLRARIRADRLGSETFDIDGLGPVVIRACSQEEMKLLRRDNPDDDDFEHALVALVIVEDPPLTRDEVAWWFAHCPAGESVEVMTAVQKMCRIGQGAAKRDLS